MTARCLILALPLLVAQCTTVKSVTQPVVSGAKKVWPWSKKQPPQEAATDASGEPSTAQAAQPGQPADAVRPGEAGPTLPPDYRFPTTGLYVTDEMLGADATHMEDQSVILDNGWIIAGSAISYSIGSGSITPTVVRAKAGPSGDATARSSGTPDATVATAREIHYNAVTGVLVLRGNARLSSRGGKLITTGANSRILLHLPTGAMKTEGTARWES